MSDSVRPHRRQPTRLRRPWDSPGKNTGVGCHFLLPCMKMKSESEVAHSCPTLSDPMDCSPPGSSAHGIFQARVLEWGAIVILLDGIIKRGEKHKQEIAPASKGYIFLRRQKIVTNQCNTVLTKNICWHIFQWRGRTQRKYL